MKFAYIPLAPIIAELQAQLKTMVKMGKFDDDDCYQYAVQCLRKIGVHEYDTIEEVLELKKHKVALPKFFYSFEDVIQVQEVFGTGTNDSCCISGKFYRKLRPMRPVDNTTLSHCQINYPCSSEMIGFTFKIPPGILTSDLKEGFIYVKYQGLKRDDSGEYMIQDEENGIEAVKNFIKMQVLEEDYLLQQIPRYIYQDIKNDFESSLSAAQGIMQAIGPAEVAGLVQRDRRRMDKFKLM